MEILIYFFQKPKVMFLFYETYIDKNIINKKILFILYMTKIILLIFLLIIIIIIIILYFIFRKKTPE